MDCFWWNRDKHMPNNLQEKSDKTQYLSRGIDYLGDIGAKLRDLQGFKTLANELIQNADDVSAATSMTFNVCDDALIVDNDGVFSDCGQIEQHECPWKDESVKGYRCDFHRFRYVASGDKRAEKGTTGAFGIGFIAAYQITDRPELMSAKRHWIMNEDRSENERIQVCPGCANCNSIQLPGTRFIFPWAKNANTSLRKALRAQAIAQSDIEALFAELNHSLLPSMLFLKHLRTIELHRNGKVHQILQRLDEGGSLILTDGQPANDRIWHTFGGEFSEEAKDLSIRHSGLIEPKRSSQVTIAIPQENECNGLFCAFLPTEQETGFPFHINADFFPSNNRKRLNLTSGYEAEWNRAAIRAAAKILAQNLDLLPKLLGHRSFWELLEKVKKVSDEAGKPSFEPALATFWKDLSPLLKTSSVVFTTRGEWAIPSKCYLLWKREEISVIPLLEKIGMKIVSEELHQYRNLLCSDAVGVPLLNIPALFNTLIDIGFDSSLEPHEWHNKLNDSKYLNKLWKEIVLLRNREKRELNGQTEHDDLLKKLSMAPVLGNRLFPCQEAFHADPSTVILFSKICPDIPFLSCDSDFEPLTDLCQPFDAATAIEVLDSLGPDKLSQAWKEKRLDIKQLFEWFENHRQEILDHTQVKQSLEKLAIYPSLGRLHQIKSLALPGDFQDHLGLAEIVDLNAIGGRQEFLRYLGMPELDFETYAKRLPDVLKSSDIAVEKRRKVVFLLAKRLGEIKGNQIIRDALAASPLVECTDGTFQKASDCYFHNETIISCLGASILTAVIPQSQVVDCQSLYEWLGVANQPRISDLLDRIKGIAGTPYDAEIFQLIITIISHLEKRIQDGSPPSELQGLQNLSWLPAKGKTDRWYKSNELFAVFHDYLFESQALFLDVPRNIQNTNSKILEFLGIQKTPSTELVVKHLLHCSQKNISIHQEVYRFLNDKAEEPKLHMLRGQKCLYLQEQERYLPPDQVFWGEHTLGRYRQQLNENLRVFGNLFKKLGVRDRPNHTDAIAVMKEIAGDFEAKKLPLDEQDQAVVLACWRLLETAIDAGRLTEQEARSLQGLKCVLNANGMLNPPEWTFFENRAGLAKKFRMFLANNVIPRPIDGGRAMAFVGVRPLGMAVEVQLLKCEDPVQDGDLPNRIHERQNALARILDAQIPSKSISEVLKRLSAIRFESAQSLVISYKLHAFNQLRESDPESTPALYLADAGRFIFTNHNGKIAWPAISRELAIALLPDQDPGRIAAGIKEVLTADSAIQADKTLDELGYPKLDTDPPKIIESVVSVNALGINEPIKKDICKNKTGKCIADNSEIIISDSCATETLANQCESKINTPSYEGLMKNVKEKKNEKSNNTTNRCHVENNVKKIIYPDEFLAVFNRPENELIYDCPYSNQGIVSDPMIRREKESKAHYERSENEPDPEERRRKTEQTILEGPDEQVRKTLEEWYGGKCQICFSKFYQRNGKPFFITCYIVQRKLARQVDNYANALCLCAEHFARWQHGPIVAKDIIDQILSLKCKNEGGDMPLRVKFKLCGEDCTITFNEKHLISLQELLNIQKAGDV